MNPSADNDEVDRIQRGVADVWKLWLPWYCWFWGINVIIFWSQQDRKWLWWESIFWFVLNFTGAIAAFFLVQYCKEVKRRAAELIGSRHLGFPMGLAILGALFNGLALTMNSVVWLAQLL